jgi:hypothetical protein
MVIFVDASTWRGRQWTRAVYGKCSAVRSATRKRLSTAQKPHNERKSVPRQAAGGDKTKKTIKITNKPAPRIMPYPRICGTKRVGISCYRRATGDHSYRMPAALAMLDQLRKRPPARGIHAHRRQEQAMLAHRSHRALEEQATPARLRDHRRRPHQDQANDAQPAASLGSPRRARPRMLAGRAHCTDRRIVHWGRRDMLGWGRGVGVAGQRMGRGRAPRWSWPRWRVRSQASCDEHRWYRCPHRPCDV